MSPDLQRRLDLAVAAALSGSARAMEYFGGGRLDVRQKADGTPVTAADRAAESEIRRRIGQAFPDDGIVGEEDGERPGRSGYRWIIDPIDGTVSFMRGVPLFGTLIGVEHAGRSVIGVIVMPALEECVYASRGGGTWHVRAGAPPVRASVSRVERLGDALLCTPPGDAYAPAGRRGVLTALETAAARCRGWCDCYGYLLVATGRADVMVDPVISVWDVAGMPPILEEAGGRFTDWRGRVAVDAGCAVASNGRVHDEVLAVTRPIE